MRYEVHVWGGEAINPIHTSDTADGILRWLSREWSDCKRQFKGEMTTWREVPIPVADSLVDEMYVFTPRCQDYAGAGGQNNPGKKLEAVRYWRAAHKPPAWWPR